LTTVLKEYADSIVLAIENGFLDENGNIVVEDRKEVENVTSLRRKIQNIITSFNPNNQEDGIFDDIIALLPETQIEQLAQAQKNILSETDQFLPINPDEYSFMESLAKNFALGKAGVKFAYETQAEILDKTISSYLPKIVNKLSTIPEIPNFESLNNFFKKITPGKIDSCNQNMFNDVNNSVSTFFEIIKNTADQLWNMTPTQYQHRIWNVRSKFVNEDGTLVDPVERIHFELIKDLIKIQYCGRAITVGSTNLNELIDKIIHEYYEQLRRSNEAPGPFGGKSRKSRKSRKRVKNTHKNKKNRQRKNKTRRRKNKTKSKK
jgi:hypothetical protein